MFLTERKFEARINELEGYRYRDCVTTDQFYKQEDEGEIGAYPPASYDPQSKMQLGDYWKGRDRYVWLHTKIGNHLVRSGEKIVGLFSFGKTGGGNNSGFESLLFVNGKPYHGEHAFVYSLHPDARDWRHAKTVEKAGDLNDPVLAVDGKWTMEDSFIEVDADHVWIDVIKPAYDENGLIIRLHEFEGRGGDVSLTISKGFISWVETDLMEDPIGTASESSIKFTIKPYEIKTIRIV